MASSKVNVPKQLVMPVGQAKIEAENGKQVSVAESLKNTSKVTKGDSASKAAITKQKQELIKAGESVFAPILFPYANGKTTWIRVQKATIRKCAIRKPPEGTLSKSGSGIVYSKTKTMYVSYGYKKVKRAKATTKGKGSKTERLVRAWLSISIPADATFADAIQFANSFSKKPGIIKVGQQSHLVDYDRAQGGAGAAK